MVVTGSGTVKAVNSGDSVVIIGKANATGVRPEQEVRLQYVEAPKLARREGSNDEPFAWPSREFLRNLLIGKTVTFKLDRAPAEGGNQAAYGDLLYSEAGKEPVSVLETCLKEGWVKLRNPDKADSVLLAAEASAKASNKGIWNEKEAAASIRKIVWAVDDIDAFCKKRKGKKCEAVLEYVRDANVMRICLLPPTADAPYTLLSVHLTGVAAPAMKKEGEPLPAYAAEAKYQVEALLLHRNVFIEIDGLDKYNNIMATISVAQGNIAVNLLKNGLAKVAEWSANLCSDPNALRLAERSAMNNKLRLWKDYAGRSADSSQGILGRVVDVPSGDTLIIRKLLPNDISDPLMSPDSASFYVANEAALTDPSQLIRVTLSSIRAPRMGKAPKPDEEPTPNEAYAVEARDHLRRKSIGKRVVVQPEYSVVMGEQKIKRDFGSVFVVNSSVKTAADGQLTSDNNLAVSLAEQGLVTVQKKKAEDMEKSKYLDDLLVAETAAQQKQKGLHSKKDTGSHPVNDVSKTGPNSRARQFLPFLLRSGRQKATVEYLANGARMKVYIPKESILISFSTNGIHCPQVDLKQAEKSEPLGRASYAFARDVLLHQEIEVEVTSMDKYGTFFGTLFVSKPEIDINYAVRVAETGLGFIEGMHVDSLPFFKDLQDAENRARDAARGVWGLKEFVAAREKAAADTAALSPKKEREILHCSVASVIDGVTAYIQRGVEEDSLTEMVNNLSIEQNKLISLPTDIALHPKKGEYCIVQLEESGWQRARCEGPASKSGSYPLQLVDIGLRTNAPASAIRSLPAAFSISKIPSHAMEVKLAYIRQSRRDDDAGAEAAEVFRSEVHDETGGKKHVIASIEYKSDEGLPAVVLLTDVHKPSVNEVLLSSGLVKLDKQRIKRADETRAELIETLADCEAKAKKNHNGIYRHGDPGDTDEDEREEMYRRRK